MKKIANAILAALACAAMVLLATACKETPEDVTTPVTISLSATPESLTLTAEEQIASIEVTTDAEEWDFINAASWIEVSRWENSLLVDVKANTSSEPRKGEIIIVATSGDTRAEKKIAVEQAAAEENNIETSFECPVFKELMLEYCDFDGDGFITASEAEQVTELVLTWADEETREAITSLKGIKQFVNLVNLDCDLNHITSLDLSGMEKLEYVDCSYNDITTLDVSNCPSLKWLYAYSNKIETIKVDGCYNLMFLQAYGNRITSLDVSEYPELIYLDLRINSLRDIDFSNCPKLNIAAIGSNELISLKLEGLPALYTLGCYENNIASLDLSNLPALEMLECYSNNIATLDLSNNPKIYALTCQRNLLSEIKIDGCKELKKLDCSSNFLAGELNLTGYNNLWYLDCSGNNYTSIEVNACTELTDLYCANTSIAALNVSALKKLARLEANDCQLTTMDCSNNKALEVLYLQGNPLTSLILAADSKIGDLKVDDHSVISYK